MALTIELEINQSTTIQEIIELTNLDYGSYDEYLVLKYHSTDTHTLLFDEQILCRGIDVFIKDQTIYLQLLLPSSKKEIELLYEVVKTLALHYSIKEFIKNKEYILIKNISSCMQEDIEESERVLFDLKENINDRIYSFYCIYNPIELSINELEHINTLDDFTNMLHDLQSIQAYYEAPRFYKNPENEIIGMLFAGINDQVILPIDPRPTFQIKETIEEYYIQIDGIYRIKYDDFISNIDLSYQYDYNHAIITINHETMYELVKYHYDISSKEYKHIEYWNELIDAGFTHASKVERMELNTDENNGYNHLAVYLKWMVEHDLISEKLLNNFSDIKNYINDPLTDLRELIKENICFNGQLRFNHFNEEGQQFTKYYYVFNSNHGFPKNVDMLAEKVLGSELYHCDEYKDEAYLFVEYDDTYIQGLYEYIDEAYKKFKELLE